MQWEAHVALCKLAPGKESHGACGKDLGLRAAWSSGVQEAPVTLTVGEPSPAGTFYLLNIFKRSQDWGQLHAQSPLQR